MEKTNPVMVVEGSLFEDYFIRSGPECAPQNTLVTGRDAIDLFNEIEATAAYEPRNLMENDPKFRQIIPYVIVENLSTRQFAAMRRCTGQGEQRLHGKRYIGFGGHIENREPIFYAMQRELSEEFGGIIERVFFIGVILTVDPNPQPDKVSVEDVHAGLLFHATTCHTNFYQELELHSPTWMNEYQLWCLGKEMELWSQVVIDNYIYRIDR